MEKLIVYIANQLQTIQVKQFNRNNFLNHKELKNCNINLFKRIAEFKIYTFLWCI